MVNQVILENLDEVGTWVFSVDKGVTRAYVYPGVRPRVGTRRTVWSACLPFSGEYIQRPFVYFVPSSTIAVPWLVLVKQEMRECYVRTETVLHHTAVRYTCRIPDGGMYINPAPD